ncbi:MAG: LacI family DNA-binding transcriptional regulator [Candidatus Auribacterota bacterium]|nr:LacI family DNA-binding transcriptional regulator [Candidatus Auribacterota bacterium]
MSVTIKNIAKEAGVSPGTVSKALNNRGGVRLPLKRKIEKIARRMSYSPYIKARQSGMYDSATKYIGIIYAYAGEQLVRDIQNGIDGVLRDLGFYELRYNVNIVGDLYNEERKKEFIDKILQDKSIVGLLSVFLKISDANIAGLQKNGIPVVLLNNYSDCGKCVLTDNVEAGFQVTKMLIGLGRKKIGLIMPEETSEVIWQERLAGYKKALSEANIAYDPYLLVYEHSFSLKESAQATKVLLEKEPGVDAIIYGSDVQAYGGMEALKEMGRKIPDDIAVIGFDDMTFSGITDPPLSSVKQPMFEMGRLAAHLLVDAIKNKDFSHQVVELKSKIIKRRSTHKEIAREKFLK